MSLLPIATAAAPSAVALAPTFPLKVIAPLPAALLILRSCIAVVPPICESITTVPVPLLTVKPSSESPVALIVEEKSIFPAPVPLLISNTAPVAFKTKAPAILISSPSVTMSSLIVIVAPVKVTSPMSLLITPLPVDGLSRTIVPPPAFKAISI